MSLDINAVINALTTHAGTLGYFDAVQGHEPKSAPGQGLTVAVFECIAAFAQ